jgi:hypothetical protein
MEANHTVDQGAPKSQEKQPSNENTFLFVNESKSGAGAKHGRRREVRSHIAKQIVRRYKKDHDASRKQESGKPQGRLIVPVEGSPLTADIVFTTAITTILGQSELKSHSRHTLDEERSNIRSGLHEELSHQEETDSSRPITFTDQMSGTTSVKEARSAPWSRCLQRSAKTRSTRKDEHKTSHWRNSRRNEIIDSGPLQLFGAKNFDPFLTVPGGEMNRPTREALHHGKLFSFTQP